MATELEELKAEVRTKHTDIHQHIRELRTDFSGMRVDMTEHAEAFIQHTEHFAQHEEEEIMRHHTYIETQQANTLAINKLVKSTEGLIEAWTTANSLARFVKWSSGIIIAIVALYAIFLNGTV